MVYSLCSPRLQIQVGCFKLLRTNLHGHRAGLLPFPVIIADLGIVFSKINPMIKSRISIHIFSPLL